MSDSNVSSAVNLVFQKESQIQALWAVYTAVQFALGAFGLGEYHDAHKMPEILGLPVVLGVWAFNFGHLSMILKCISQNEAIKEEIILSNSLSDAEKGSVNRVIAGKKEGEIGYWINVRHVFGRGYKASILIHLFIDVCASVVLLSRVSFS